MRYLIIFLFLFFCTRVYPQFVQHKSIQLMLHGQGNHFGVVPAGENGVVIFSETKNLGSTSKRRWEVINLDTDLVLKWRTYFESDYNFAITQVKYYKGFIYLMFKDSNLPMKSVFFVRVSISEDNFDFFEISEFLPKDIVGFEMLGNSLFLIGVDEGRPAILKFRFGDPRPLVLRGLYNENNDLLHTEVLPDHNIIQVVTRMKKRGEKKFVILVKQFDEFGNIYKDILIESNKGYDLLNATVKTDEEENICVVGSYSYRNSKYSNGLFTMVYNGNEEQSIYYYDYTNLHNYFSYLPLKDQEKMAKKYKQEKSGDKKSKYKVNHQPREIIKVGDDWMYIGETVKFTEKNTRVYGNMWPLEYRQYSHAVILGIASNGRLKWDNSMSLNDLSTPSARQQAFMNENGDHSLIYYLHGSSYNYKVIDEGEVITKNGIFELNIPGVEDMKTKGQNIGEILPWYGNKFLTFGSYGLEPVFGEQKNFFFLNKISISEIAQ